MYSKWLPGNMSMWNSIGTHRITSTRWATAKRCVGMPNPEFYSRIRAGPMTPRRCEIGRRGVQEIEHHPCHQHDDGYHRAAGPGKFFAPNLWPQSVPGMRPVWEAYYRE